MQKSSYNMQRIFVRLGLLVGLGLILGICVFLYFYFVEAALDIFYLTNIEQKEAFFVEDIGSAEKVIEKHNQKLIR